MIRFFADVRNGKLEMSCTGGGDAEIKIDETCENTT